MKFVNILLLSLTILFSLQGFSQTDPITISGQLGENIFENSFTNDGFFKISPDGSKVAYQAATKENTSHTSNLYLVGINGENPVALFQTSQIGFVRNFEFTPDSTKLVVAAGLHIYVVDIKSTKITQLDSDDSINSQFTISNDGKYVVYSDSSLYNIYSANIDSGKITLLNDVSFNKRDSIKYEISNDSTFVAISTPEGSADGTRTINSHLYTIPINGGPINQLLPQGFNDVYSWSLSPDSKFIRFSILSANLEIFSKNLTTGEIYDVSNKDSQNSDAFGATFSPDGQSILFLSIDLPSGSHALKLASKDGAHIETLTPNNPTLDRFCGYNFSPTNRHIVFCARDSSNPHSSANFYSVNIGTGLIKNIDSPSEQFDLANLYTAFAPSSDTFIVSNVSSNDSLLKHKLVAFELSSDTKKVLLDYSSNNVGCFDSGVFDVKMRTITTCTNTDKNDLSSVSQFYLDSVSIEEEEIAPEIDRALFFKTAAESNNLVYLAVVGKTESNKDILALRSAKTPERLQTLCIPVKTVSKKISVVCL